jgi:16S rRNA (guanine1207-N2)-methyltransferase
MHVLSSALRSPLLIVMGSPRSVAELLHQATPENATCYQMDLYQAERLRQELQERGLKYPVLTAADVWDLPADIQSVLYPVTQGSERILKIDLVEQSFHVLRPQGTLFVHSPYRQDQLFPSLLKKIFGQVHRSPHPEGTLFWSVRKGQRPRRRHEVTFHARAGDGPSLCFLSRPGVFSYGRFDEGARALVEVMQIQPGENIVDLGCGCGTNGIFAARRSGPEGRVAFVDSNVRAVALTEINARANGVEQFQAVASAHGEGLPEASFDVVLANPPYYAQSSIARLFVERARVLLRPGGRLYLVTKQLEQVEPIVAEQFGQAEVWERRGYFILSAFTGSSLPILANQQHG